VNFILDTFSVGKNEVSEPLQKFFSIGYGMFAKLDAPNLLGRKTSLDVLPSCGNGLLDHFSGFLQDIENCQNIESKVLGYCFGQCYQIVTFNITIW
jgi:hypothetical protein